MHAGVDLGGTNCRALVVDGGAECGRATRETPDGRKAVETAIQRTLEAACVDAGVEVGSLSRVGVTVPGTVEDGIAVDPVNVATDRIDVRNALSETAVRVRNDATAAVIGERVVADAPADLVFLTISTGIGAGVVVDGNVLGGVADAAGELGHVPIVPDGRECQCGARGCWEAYCSGRSIPALARELASETPTALDLSTLDARTVLEAVGEDPLADAVRERLAQYNVRGVTAVARAYAPDRISVGGSVALAHPWLLDDIRERLPETPFPTPTIRATPLGSDAALWGAVSLACTGATGNQPPSGKRLTEAETRRRTGDRGSQ